MKLISKLNQKQFYFEVKLSSKSFWLMKKSLTIALNTFMKVSCYSRLYSHSQQISEKRISLSLAASPYMTETFTKNNYASAQIWETNSSLIFDDLHQRAQAILQEVFLSHHDVHVVTSEKNRILTNIVEYSSSSKISEDTEEFTLLTINSITINSDTNHSTHSSINNLSAVNDFVNNSTETFLATYDYQLTHTIVSQTLKSLMKFWSSANNFTASLIVQSLKSHNLFSVSEVMSQTHQSLMITWDVTDNFAASSIVWFLKSHNLFSVNEIMPQTHQSLLTTWNAAENISVHRNSYDSVLQTSSL